MATTTTEQSKRGRPKGGFVKKVNDGIAAKKAEKEKNKKPDGKGDGFEELSELELAAQSGRKPVPVQGELPTMETPKLKDVIRAAEDYRTKRDRRMKMLVEEVGARTLLQGLMEKHQLRHYSYEGLVVEIVSSDKVKVRVDDDE